jgi:hypothetical protein
MLSFLISRKDFVPLSKWLRPSALLGNLARQMKLTQLLRKCVITSQFQLMIFSLG